LQIVGVFGLERSGIEILLAGHRHDAIAYVRGLPLRVRELERIDAEKCGRREADRRWLLRGQERLGDGVANQILVQRRGFGRILSAGADGNK
jgi:hypothetical protein